MSEWIDVKDRLPNAESQVLTYSVPEDIYEVARYLRSDRVTYWTNSRIRPTHWKQLNPPSQPTGEPAE